MAGGESYARAMVATGPSVVIVGSSVAGRVLTGWRADFPPRGRRGTPNRTPKN